LDSHHPRQQAAFGQYPKAPILVGGEQVGINVLFIIETCAKLGHTRPEVVAFMHDLAAYTACQPLHRMRLLEPLVR
jgi:hypothetical protein